MQRQGRKAGWMDRVCPSPIQFLVVILVSASPLLVLLVMLCTSIDVVSYPNPSESCCTTIQVQIYKKKR